jgi:predicted acyltransferase
VVLLLVSLLLGAILTPSNQFSKVYYATGAVPIVLVTAYVLAYRAEDNRFPRFLAVTGVSVLIIYLIGVVLSPTEIGIGTGWIALAAAFFAAYAIVYTDERAIDGASVE